MQYQQQDASAKFINTLKSTAPDLVEYIATTNQTGFENPENRRQMLEAAKLTIDQMSESEGEILRHMVTSIITRPPEQHQQQLNSKDGQSAVWTPHGYASAKDAELKRLEQIDLNIDQGGRFDNRRRPRFLGRTRGAPENDPPQDLVAETGPRGQQQVHNLKNLAPSSPPSRPENRPPGKPGPVFAPAPPPEPWRDSQ